MKDCLDRGPLPPNIVAPELRNHPLHRISLCSDLFIAAGPGESALADKNASRLAMKSIAEISR